MLKQRAVTVKSYPFWMYGTICISHRTYLHGYTHIFIRIHLFPQSFLQKYTTKEILRKENCTFPQIPKTKESEHNISSLTLCIYLLFFTNGKQITGKRIHTIRVSEAFVSLRSQFANIAHNEIPTIKFAIILSFLLTRMDKPLF